MLARPQIIRSSPLRGDHLDAGARAGVIQRLLSRVGLSEEHAASMVGPITRLVLDPSAMAAAIDTATGIDRIGDQQTLVVGALDRRVVLVPDGSGRHVAAALSRPLSESIEPLLAWPGVALSLDDPWSGSLALPASARDRLIRPHVRLVSLYHPENFPLPRFALGISDMARSLRRQMIGRVDLVDMQLGATADAIVADVTRDRPDIVGISSTFGQHDVFEYVVAAIRRIPNYAPWMVAGGSLAVLHADRLAADGIVVALGPGELTMTALVRCYRGEIALDAVPGACFVDASGSLRRTAGPTNRLYDDILPDLDLAEATLDAGGVIQLESSRGCSYACSFCPREHKGIWAGEGGSAFEAILPDLAGLFDRRPAVARKLFLVDEEFYGYAPEAAARAEGVAAAIAAHGFRFETSSRVDQVYRPREGAGWHVERLRSWRRLLASGLDRCLFGVESGVDTILDRFNKKTNARQNVLAIRMLGALGVPIRCTYITFDPLMTMAELEATAAFLARTDILVAAQAGMAEEEIWNGAADDDWVATRALGRPFYSAVSYMLVSMECLVGSPYLKAAERRGLAGPFNPNMGRRDARFADPRIGAMSHLAQGWVDRHFSLDYLLKSIEKVTVGPARTTARAARSVLKESAHGVLVAMIEASRDGIISPHGGEVLLDGRCSMLAAALLPTIDALAPLLARDLRSRVDAEIARWSARRGWEHINAA